MTNHSKTTIKSLLLTFIIMGTTALPALAQTGNNAKLITKIKKDQTYIFAEATDTTEEAAYKTAKAELDKYIEEYIITSGKAENADYVIVKGIGLITYWFGLSWMLSRSRIIGTTHPSSSAICLRIMTTRSSKSPP